MFANPKEKKKKKKIYIIKYIFPRNNSGNNAPCKHIVLSHKGEYFYALGLKTELF